MNPGEMNVGIGIDGGQTGIRLRLAVAGEKPYEPLLLDGQRRNGGLGYQAIADAVAEISSCAERPIGRVVAGLSALPAEDSEIAQLGAELSRAAGGAEVWIGDDTATSHAGAFGGRAGVVLAVGTGAVAFAFDPATRRRQLVDGAGYLLGDDGGGFWIGRGAVRAVLHASEGRGATSSLEPRITDLLGPVEDLPTRIHQDPHAVRTVAGLAHLVLREATAGDPVSIQIVEEAATSLHATVAAAAASITTAEEVAFTGRLLGDQSLLCAQLTRRLADQRESLTVGPAAGTSLDGACHLAVASSDSPYRELFTVTEPGAAV